MIYSVFFLLFFFFIRFFAVSLVANIIEQFYLFISFRRCHFFVVVFILVVLRLDL